MLLRGRAVTLTNYDEVARLVNLEPAEMVKRAGLSYLASSSLVMVGILIRIGHFA